MELALSLPVGFLEVSLIRVLMLETDWDGIILIMAGSEL